MKYPETVLCYSGGGRRVGSSTVARFIAEDPQQPARRDFRNMTVTNVELLKLGLRIRASRKVLGWTQKRFSRNCGLDRSYFGGVERGKRNMTFSVLCQICDSLSCDIATVTKGIPHLQTVGGLASGSRVLDSDRERAEGKFQKPGKMGSKKEREIV